MMTNSRVLTAARANFGVVAGLVLATMAAGCANGPATATSPSAGGVASTDARGGAVKAFTVGVSPQSVSAGSADLTVTVTNDLATNPASLSLGSVRLSLPAGLAVTAVNTFGGSKAWGTTWTTGESVVVGASNGTQKLGPGESVTFHIVVNATSCGTHPLTTPAGSSETLGGTFSADWTYMGSALAVTVTGCVISECPAAPAIAGDYLRDQLGMHPNDDPYKNIVAQVALHMSNGASFNGILPCAPGYAAAVIAFVNGIVG